MQKFTTLTGIAAPFAEINVDTDKIIPKQFLKTIKRTGLKDGLFYEMRWTADGQKKDFVLDQPAYQNAKILVAGPNFGCGSSREHAPWALADYGFRVVIAPSFADIFFNNCFQNGLLPIVLKDEAVDRLFHEVAEQEGYAVTVDLPQQEVCTPGGERLGFEIGAFRKHCLLNGLDDIGLTLQETDAIRAFERRHREQAPWMCDTQA